MFPAPVLSRPSGHHLLLAMLHKMAEYVTVELAEAICLTGCDQDRREELDAFRL
jgi:hypothetical protein